MNLDYRQINNSNSLKNNNCTGIEDASCPPLPILQFLARAMGVRCHLDLVEYGFRYPTSLVGPLLDKQHFLTRGRKLIKGVLAGLVGPNCLELRHFMSIPLTMVSTLTRHEDEAEAIQNYRKAAAGKPKKEAFVKYMESRKP